VTPAARPHDIAEAGPIDPATGQPDHGVEVSALTAWFKDNMVSLVITAVIVALVVIYLDPIDTLKVVLGLGLVIFIHELGHFLAAKWCDVHVKTFSIGFGPAVPFCSYKWGETTYMIGIIPLGGYVSMVGEGDNAGDDEAEEDPRSFRKKTVGQRMLIISAGVVMNILLGMACFVAAYLHGVREEPAVAGSVVSGGAAWRAGMRTEDHIVQIDSRVNPTFKDLRPIVMSTRAGEKVEIFVERDGKVLDKPLEVEPLREEGTYFPTLGIAAPSRPALLSLKKKGFRPVVPGSPAALAQPAFEPGDRIVAMTDPADPTTITPLKPDPKEPEAGPDMSEYYQRLAKLAGQPVTYRVVRKEKDAGGLDVTADIKVDPSFRADVGARMKMAKVAAVRAGSPAEKADVQAVKFGEPPTSPGDQIAEVSVTEPDGTTTRYVDGDTKEPPQPGVTVKKLDPILLPLELKKWAGRNPKDLTVKLVVLRTIDHKENARVPLTLKYDMAFQNDRETVALPNSPVPIPGLGLAYWVEATVDEVTPGGPAAQAGLKPGDLITAVRFKSFDEGGHVKAGEWEEIKPHQWASAEAAFQSRPPFEMDLKVKRGQEELELTLKGEPDKNWPTEDRGLVFQPDYRTHKAADIGDAIRLGALRTVRFIKEVYMNLYGMIAGRISAKTMSGPLTIANVSYRFAGEDFWQFLLFLGLISVNLAVVNFLPIPVLDGGHMVFLMLEKILGRPVPERVFAFAMYTGLFLILSLMVFVLWLDIRRLFFGWF
jgi:regulator of sigma E protease